MYSVQHLVTAELRDVHVARMRVYADDQLEITGELFKVFRQLRTRASTTSGAYRLSRALQAATSSLSRRPGKDWRRRRQPVSRCHACSMTRRPCCGKCKILGRVRPTTICWTLLFPNVRTARSIKATRSEPTRGWSPRDGLFEGAVPL